jgi:nucleotide-binding universal stress UspA family protein
MKTILFPTDFSEAANGALRVAKQLTKQSSGTLHVLHSIDSVQRYVDMSLSSTGDAMIPGFEPELLMKMIEKQKTEANEELEKLKKSLEAEGISVVTHLSTADLLMDLNELAEKESIELIVMGTHGASGFREAFVGSNAQKVVRNCKVPVLTVRDADKDFTMDTIVYASDFLEEEINAQLPRVKKLVDSVGAELHLLHVNTPAYFEQTDDVLERMEVVAEAYEVADAMQYIYNDFTIEEGILNYCRLVEADLAVLVTHGFTGIKRFLGDNVTETVVNHAKIPVLSLHVQPEK